MSNYLLQPAILLMGRLRYSAKFALIAILFLAPLSLVSFFFLREINIAIDFARNERTGVRYIRTIKPVLTNAIRLNLHGGIHAAPAEIQTVEDGLKNAQMLSQEAADLKVSDKFTELSKLWTSAKSGQVPLEQFISSVNDFITTVGNNSQLILDPDVDSYYVMDSVVVQLESAEIQIGAATKLVSEIAGRGKLTPEERTAVTVLQARGSIPVGNVQSDLTQASDANPIVKATLSPLQNKYQTGSAEFDALLTKGVVSGRKLAVARSTAIDAGEKCFAASEEYFDASSQMLDRLLSIREDGFVTRRNTVSIVVLLCLLGAIYCFVGFYRVTVLSITNMVSVARQIAQGDFNQEVVSSTRDEIGQLSNDLRGMSESLRSIATAAGSIARGDLTVNVNPRSDRDALGHSLCHMVDELRQFIGAVSESASQLDRTGNVVSAAAVKAASSAQSVSIAIQDIQTSAELSADTSRLMASGLHDHAKSTNDVHEAMNVLERTLNEVVASTRHQEAGSKTVETVVAEALTAMDAVLKSIHETSHQVDLSQAALLRLGKKGCEIESLVAAIDGIADQTNMLALNASIEAARAGVHGRGFSVVAEEVRRLANECRKATQDVSELMSEIRSEISQSSVSLTRSVELANDCSKRGADAKSSLHSAREHTTELTAEASRLGGTASGMVNRLAGSRKSLEAIVGVAKETALGAEQTSAAANHVQLVIEKVSSDVLTQSEVVHGIADAAEDLRQMSAALNEQLAHFEIEETRSLARVA